MKAPLNILKIPEGIARILFFLACIPPALVTLSYIVIIAMIGFDEIKAKSEWQKILNTPKDNVTHTTARPSQQKQETNPVLNGLDELLRRGSRDDELRAALDELGKESALATLDKLKHYRDWRISSTKEGLKNVITVVVASLISYILLMVIARAIIWIVEGFKKPK